MRLDSWTAVLHILVLDNFPGIPKADKCDLSIIHHNIFLFQVAEGVSSLMYLLNNFDQLTSYV